MQQAPCHQGLHQSARLPVADAEQGGEGGARHLAEQHRVFQRRIHAPVQPIPGRFRRYEFAHPGTQGLRRQHPLMNRTWSRPAAGKKRQD